MSTPARLAAYLAALVAVFAGAWALGNAVGPLDDDPAPATHTEHAR